MSEIINTNEKNLMKRNSRLILPLIRRTTLLKSEQSTSRVLNRPLNRVLNRCQAEQKSLTGAAEQSPEQVVDRVLKGR